MFNRFSTNRHSITPEVVGESIRPALEAHKQTRPNPFDAPPALCMCNHSIISVSALRRQAVFKLRQRMSTDSALARQASIICAELLFHSFNSFTVSLTS